MIPAMYHMIAVVAALITGVPTDDLALRAPLRSVANATGLIEGTAPQATAGRAAAADRGRILGNPSASVWLIIASDFQCPFCRRWHEESWETIRREYVVTGKVRVAYVNLPLEMHANARPAAIAAMCAAADGRFWEFADQVFQSQDEWKDLRDASSYFDRLARRATLDPARMRACVRDSAIAAAVDADRVRMGRAGVASTPTFFVGRARIEGAQPLARFRSVLDAELAAARRP